MAKRYLAWCFGFLIALASPAQAASGYDMTDAWWVPAESGWGLQLVQQRDTVFATLYVYGNDGAPRWYSGTLAFTGLTPQQRTPNYAGDLYETTGTWFGAAQFAPPAYRRVGTIAVTAQSMTHATLDYAVDGAAVRKAIERMTFVLDAYAGQYAGAFAISRTRCDDPAQDGTRVLAGTYAVTQDGASMGVIADWPGNTCSFAGPYVQHGRLGSVSAQYTCSDGERGTLVFEEMNIQRFGWTGRLFGLDNRGCHLEGRFGAARV